MEEVKKIDILETVLDMLESHIQQHHRQFPGFTLFSLLDIKVVNNAEQHCLSVTTKTFGSLPGGDVEVMTLAPTGEPGPAIEVGAFTNATLALKNIFDAKGNATTNYGIAEKHLISNVLNFMLKWPPGTGVHVIPSGYSSRVSHGVKEYQFIYTVAQKGCEDNSYCLSYNADALMEFVDLFERMVSARPQSERAAFTVASAFKAGKKKNGNKYLEMNDHERLAQDTWIASQPTVDGTHGTKIFAAFCEAFGVKASTDEAMAFEIRRGLLSDKQPVV